MTNTRCAMPSPRWYVKRFGAFLTCYLVRQELRGHYVWEWGDKCCELSLN
ncbi:hypothetical protein [Spirosoma sp. KUDC1026]|nr:hypothetical protein [Spirosoma sp. KUDC1026]QKZ15194.1 hypothetical protein HU175_22235 [Spirosoma sp. KUDC1026]